VAADCRHDRARGSGFDAHAIGYLPGQQGGYGINMREVNSLLNSRKQSSLGNQSAADVWGASMALVNGDPGIGAGDYEVDEAIIDTAYNAQLARAEARRGPSAATTKPFEEGDSVRRFNMRWMPKTHAWLGRRCRVTPRFRPFRSQFKLSAGADLNVQGCRPDARPAPDTNI